MDLLSSWSIRLSDQPHISISDDQLEQTNAGLVGKSMPNFGDINKELAKECKEEFEPEVESESDRKLSAIWIISSLPLSINPDALL